MGLSGFSAIFLAIFRHFQHFFGHNRDKPSSWGKGVRFWTRFYEVESSKNLIYKGKITKYTKGTFFSCSCQSKNNIRAYLSAVILAK